jgi:flagellar hook-associated protein 3 FlgL
MMRVTVGSSSYAALHGLRSDASRLAALQAKLSSGKQITKPSDNPSGTIQALQLRGDAARNAQYATNSTDAIGFMDSADSTYKQMVNLAQKAQTLVVQGLNSGASTGSSNAAIADQIDKIRSSLLDLANTTYNGRSVFGGTTAGGKAYNDDGTYVGDAGAVKRQVGPSTTVQINQRGPQIFDLTTDATANPAGASNVFDLLSKVTDALHGAAGAPPLSDTLSSLQTAVGNISSAQATEGAVYSQVQMMQTVQATAKTSLASQLSNIQDIDLAETAVQVSTAQVTYQAALQTTANIRQMSLLNFLH